MDSKKLSLIAGIGYIIIFFAAIFANFLVLESLQEAPVETIQQNGLMVRFGIMAFLITVVFDVVVAWALNELYKRHILMPLCTLFRMMHAAIMGVAIFVLPLILSSTDASEILDHIVVFNTIWLIGLFFFGIHLILLAWIIKKPHFIALFLLMAGIMYILDTTAHFILVDYDNYKSLFLALVAVPSILGEMSFAIWLLWKASKNVMGTNNI